MNLRDRERGEHLRNSYNMIRQTQESLPLNMIPWRSEGCYGDYMPEQKKVLVEEPCGRRERTSTQKVRETPVSGERCLERQVGIWDSLGRGMT